MVTTRAGVSLPGLASPGLASPGLFVDVTSSCSIDSEPVTKVDKNSTEICDAPSPLLLLLLSLGRQGCGRHKGGGIRTQILTSLGLPLVQ